MGSLYSEHRTWLHAVPAGWKLGLLVLLSTGVFWLSMPVALSLACAASVALFVSLGAAMRPAGRLLKALGIAAVLVLLFHANIAFPGGFVGVDVFFVISGYLITSLILRDVAGSKFSFYEYWKRRTRRIIPASATMVLVVLAFGFFLLFPSDYLDLGKVALFQSVGLSKVYFWKSI